MDFNNQLCAGLKALEHNDVQKEKVRLSIESPKTKLIVKRLDEQKRKKTQGKASLVNGTVAAKDQMEPHWLGTIKLRGSGKSLRENKVLKLNKNQIINTISHKAAAAPSNNAASPGSTTKKGPLPLLFPTSGSVTGTTPQGSHGDATTKGSSESSYLTKIRTCMPSSLKIEKQSGKAIKRPKVKLLSTILRSKPASGSVI